jgi:hypothetical protein
MMKLAGSRRRALLALAGLAAVAGAPAWAADDKSTISSIMELVGVSSDPSAASIDYRERPKLVLPPRAGELPSPTESSARPAGWPVDAAGARQRGSDRYARIQGAAPEERKPGLFERALSAGAGSEAPAAVNEPGRRMLTDPPAGYRRPTKDVSLIADPDARKGDWWNPMTYINGGSGAAKPAPGQQQAQPQHRFYLPFVSKEIGGNE